MKTELEAHCTNMHGNYSTSCSLVWNVSFSDGMSHIRTVQSSDPDNTCNESKENFVLWTALESENNIKFKQKVRVQYDSTQATGVLVITLVSQCIALSLSLCYFTLSNAKWFYLWSESLWVGKG